MATVYPDSRGLLVVVCACGGTGDSIFDGDLGSGSSATILDSGTSTTAPQLIVVSPDPQGTDSFACALEIRLTPLNLELIDPAQTDGTATDGQGHFHIQINDVHIVGDPPLGRPQFNTAIDVPLRTLRLEPGQQTLTITTQQNDDANYPGIPATRVTWDYPGHPEDGCNPENGNPEGGNPGGGS